MKLFNRNKSDSSNNDIQNYYASENRQRTSVAWMLAGATLVVTLLLALGIFYGGRWAYREIFSDDSDVNVVQQEDQGINGEDNPVGLEGDTGSNSTEQTNDSEQTANGSDTSGNSNSAGTSNSTQGTASTGSSNLPASGALPSTGPSEPEL